MKSKRQSQSIFLQCGGLSPTQEESVLAMDQNSPFTSKPLWQAVLKKYDEAVANLPKLTKETTEQSTKQPVEKTEASPCESSS